MCMWLVSPVLCTGGVLLSLETAWAGAVGLGEWVCCVMCSFRTGCRLFWVLCCEGSKQVCIFLVHHVLDTGGLLVVETACGKPFALNLRVQYECCVSEGGCQLVFCYVIKEQEVVMVHPAERLLSGSDLPLLVPPGLGFVDPHHKSV